jgi:transcriptional regulator with XRE-family HTH domain
LIRDVWAGNVKLGPFEIPRSEIRCPECGHSMGTIAATKTCQGLHDYCPDVSELRRLLGRAMGVASATQERLAELVGCSHDAIREWEHGKHRPSRAFRSKLVELEGKLKDGGLSLDAALTGRVEAEQPARPTPTFVNVVSAKLDGDLALLHFGAKLPGDKEPRTVADVLVSRAALEKALGTSLPGARMPGSNSVGGEG